MPFPYKSFVQCLLVDVVVIGRGVEAAHGLYYMHGSDIHTRIEFALHYLLPAFMLTSGNCDSSSTVVTRI